MTILGKFEKQPREEEIYAFQFVEDMAATDNITSGYCALMLGAQAVPYKDITAPYDATLADDGTMLYSGFSITIPVDAPLGYRLMVANTDQDSSIAVDSLVIPARGAAIGLMTADGWVAEISASAVVVSVADDQRIRVFVKGGLNKSTYKVQATATTAEARVMEDEVILKIKEV